jgi:phage/plasmid-associated DNA primase
MVVSTRVKPAFANLQEFELFVRDIFINGSGISPELFDAAVEFHQDVEVNHGMDAETPIHDELGWYFSRFGYQCKDSIYAAFLRNEDGSLWQALVNIPNGDKPYSYLAPKENGDRAFFPPVPQSIREKIASKYGVEVPLDGSFWESVKDNPDIPRGLTEGGKKSLSALSNGFIFIALYGCNCGREWEAGDALLSPDLEPFAEEGSKWLLGLDRDTKPKAKKAVIAAKKNLATALQGYGCYVNDIFWKPSQGKGLDDFIVKQSPDKFNFIYQLALAKIEEALGENAKEEKLSFCQIALQHLYSDNDYICAANKLYRWDGSYYKLVSDGSEKRRIRDFCNSYCKTFIDKETGKLTKYYPYAKNTKIGEALDWAKQSFHIDIDQLNPSGLNCLNGILQIVWDGDKPSWELVDHSPNYYYTYPPLVEYDPKADPYHCDRLLDALDAPQREIFLKVIAASLDLPNVRKYKGRLIRALLLRGTGSNGKDALREAVSTIFGKQGVTSATLNDFQQYDDGRRFPLSSLIYSRINWASENTNSSKLDRIQSLKAAITGNPLVAEAKGKDGQEFTPNTVFLFNINDVPNLQGSLEAILSRYGVLDFKKTYKTNADPTKGELEADPRFAYDPLFLRLMVCPALLNRLLDALKDLMINGIDYSCTQQALEDIQAENSHLFQFIQDTGLSYDPNSYLSASDIWTRLEQWYLDDGTLTYEETSNGKQKAIWADQVRFGDRNIKAVNQVLARFKQLFPKAKLATIPHPNGKKLQQVLQGITFSSLSIRSFSTPISENSTPIPPQSPPQQILINQDFHPNHPQFSNTEENNQKNNQNTPGYPNQILQSQNKINNPQNSEVEKSENFGSGWGGTPIKQGFDGVVTGVVTGVENNLIGVENNLIENETPQTIYEAGDDILYYPTYNHKNNNWKVKAKITSITYENGYFVGCDVEYWRKGEIIKSSIAGGNFDWILGKA